MMIDSLTFQTHWFDYKKELQTLDNWPTNSTIVWRVAFRNYNCSWFDLPNNVVNYSCFHFGLPKTLVNYDYI